MWIAVDLGRYLNKDKKQRPGKPPDPGTLSSLPPNAEAASTPLQTHESSNPDISTVALESDANARPVYTFEITDRSGVDTTESLPLESPVVR